MAYQYRGAVLDHPAELLEYLVLGLGIQGGRRLVENEYLRLPEKRPR